MKTDWNNLQSVIRTAQALGPGMTVYKHPQRSNYNITHTVREAQLFPGSQVMHRT